MLPLVLLMSLRCSYDLLCVLIGSSVEERVYNVLYLQLQFIFQSLVLIFIYYNCTKICIQNCMYQVLHIHFYCTVFVTLSFVLSFFNLFLIPSYLSYVVIHTVHFLTIHHKDRSKTQLGRVVGRRIILKLFFWL